jgi:hypothetical protein
LDKNKIIEASFFLPDSIEHPYAWVGHLSFASWLIREVNPKVFVELGTHTGNSYFSFCLAVKMYGLDTKCYAIDTWMGDDHAQLYGEEIFVEVDKKNSENYSKFSRLLRMRFDEALQNFENESIGILHIDGLHTYDAVKHDFYSWLPKLAPGAIVLFHDINVFENDFGVWKLWEELKDIYPFHFEFTHSFGLGVLQIMSQDKNHMQTWLSHQDSNRQMIKRYFETLALRQTSSMETHWLESQNTDLTKEKKIRDNAMAELHQKAVDRQEQIEQLQAEASRRDNAMAELHQKAVDRQEQIEQLQAEASRRDNAMAELHQKAVDWHEELQQLKSQVIQIESTIWWRLRKLFI